MALSDFAGKVDDSKVTVMGVTYPLTEFNMQTRGLWLDIIEEYGLTEMQRKIQTEVVPVLSGRRAEIENDPRVRSIEARLTKLQRQHDGLLEKYGEDDEPDDIDEQIEKNIARQDALSDELVQMTEKVKMELLGDAQGAEGLVSEFMERQDEARMLFAWRLANVTGKTELEFEDWCNKATASDYEAAERLLEMGNARWASLYGNRMQERPKKNRQKN